MTSNTELHTRRQQAVPRGVTNSLAVYAERAVNAELWDVEGRRYIGCRNEDEARKAAADREALVAA